MSKTIRIIVGLAVVVIVVVGGYSVIMSLKGPSSAEEIKIGVILPLTGDLSSVAEEVQKGINLFSESHLDVEFIIENDEGEAKKAITALKKLTSLDGISYVLGPLGPMISEAVYASQTDIEKDELLFIAMSMCADQFKGFANMLCIYPSPYFQLKESYKFPKSVDRSSFYAILANDAFGEDIREMLQGISEELSLELLGKDMVNVNDLEFSTVAYKAIATNPQFIVVATMDQPANIKIIKAIKERGYDGMVLSGGDFEEKMVKKFQGVLEGVYMTGQAKLDYGSDFLEAYSEQQGGAIPSLYTAFGYVWADILYNMLKQGQQFTIEDIMDYVDSRSDTLAIKGMKFDQANKEIKFPMQVFLVKDGSLETVFVSGGD